MTHDRRKRQRLRLRLRVLLHRTESNTFLQTDTADISNNGFYCNTTQPFTPGEKLACLIALPVNASGPASATEQFYLEAMVEVIRITLNNGIGFGIACQILEYVVIASHALPLWATSTAEQARSAAAIEQPA